MMIPDEQTSQSSDELLTEFAEEKSAKGGSASGGKESEKSKKKKIVRAKKKKEYPNVPKARVYVQSTYNNTMITFTDTKGDVLAISSAGRCGFRGPKKSTAYAAGVIVRDVMERVKPYGVQEVEVFLKGIGSGRDAAIRSLNAQGMLVTSIKDMTPLPHNGCRAPKIRRV